MNDRGTLTQNYDVFSHDVKLLFGDLKFRLFHDHPQEVKKMIAAQEFNQLMRQDELFLYGPIDNLLRYY